MRHDRRLSSYDRPTGTFMYGRGHHVVHGQLDDVERFLHEGLREVAARRQRLAEEARAVERLAALP